MRNGWQKIMTTSVNSETFTSEVLEQTKLVLVDFWAEWCGPCRMVGPIIDELSKDFEGKAVVGKIDVDSNSINPFTKNDVELLEFICNKIALKIKTLKYGLD